MLYGNTPSACRLGSLIGSRLESVCVHKAHSVIALSVPGNVPKRGPTTIRRQRTPTKYPTKTVSRNRGSSAPAYSARPQRLYLAIFVMNASPAVHRPSVPHAVEYAPVVVGKFNEFVKPVTYALPAPSMAMPFAKSALLPPRQVE